MARKNAKGSGIIRKKTVTRSGKEYTYWEARITTGQWLDVWAADYLRSVKPATVMIYRCNIKNHIKPALGAAWVSSTPTRYRVLSTA